MKNILVGSIAVIATCVFASSALCENQADCTVSGNTYSPTGDVTPFFLELIIQMQLRQRT